MSGASASQARALTSAGGKEAIKVTAEQRTRRSAGLLVRKAPPLGASGSEAEIPGRHNDPAHPREAKQRGTLLTGERRAAGEPVDRGEKGPSSRQEQFLASALEAETLMLGGRRGRLEGDDGFESLLGYVGDRFVPLEDIRRKIRAAKDVGHRDLR